MSKKYLNYCNWNIYKESKLTSWNTCSICKDYFIDNYFYQHLYDINNESCNKCYKKFDKNTKELYERIERLPNIDDRWECDKCNCNINKYKKYYYSWINDEKFCVKCGVKKTNEQLYLYNSDYNTNNDYENVPYYWKHGKVQVGEYGCGEIDSIILNGKQKGCVSFHCCIDYTHLYYFTKSFFDYILNTDVDKY